MKFLNSNSVFRQVKAQEEDLTPSQKGISKMWAPDEQPHWYDSTSMIICIISSQRLKWNNKKWVPPHARVTPTDGWWNCRIFFFDFERGGWEKLQSCFAIMTWTTEQGVLILSCPKKENKKITFFIECQRPYIKISFPHMHGWLFPPSLENSMRFHMDCRLISGRLLCITGWDTLEAFVVVAWSGTLALWAPTVQCHRMKGLRFDYRQLWCCVFFFSKLAE